MTDSHDIQVDEPSALDYVSLLIENGRLLIAVPLLTVVLAWAATFIFPPIYTSSTRLLPPQPPQSSAAMLASQLGPIAGLVGLGGLGAKNPIDTYISLITSRTVADRLIDRFDLMRVFGDKYRVDARRRLADATLVTAAKDGIITIEVDWKDPQTAAAIANAYVEELWKLSGDLALTESQQRRVFFENQLRTTQANLQKAEAALGQANVGENLLKSAPQAVVESVARLKAQVTAQEVRLATMRGFLTESNPDYQIAQRELASLRAQLSQVQQQQPSGDAKSTEYLNRFREFKYQETLFELMAKQYEAARLDEAREGAVIQVVDKAVPPELKSKPRRGLIAILAGAIVGLLIAFSIFLKDWLRRNSSDTPLMNKLQRIRSASYRLLRFAK